MRVEKITSTIENASSLKSNAVDSYRLYIGKIIPPSHSIGEKKIVGYANTTLIA